MQMPERGQVEQAQSGARASQRVPKEEQGYALRFQVQAC